jgi:hypothetical protein
LINKTFYSFLIALFLLASCILPASAAPAPIAGQGYHLAFEDQFDKPDFGLTGHTWCAGMWYEKPAAIGTEVTWSHSQLHLTCFKSNGFHGVTVCTNWHDSKGGTFFRYGYFEARIKVAPYGNNAFWSFSKYHSDSLAVVPADPKTYTSEVDFLETDGDHPTTVVNTVHFNTSSFGGVSDKQNGNNVNPVAVDITKDFHVYGCLVTPTLVTWYLDAKPVASAPTYPSTDQDRYLVFDLAPGGVLGTKVPDTVDHFTMDIDWVRVWRGRSPPV